MYAIYVYNLFFFLFFFFAPEERELTRGHRKGRTGVSLFGKGENRFSFDDVSKPKHICPPFVSVLAKSRLGADRLLVGRDSLGTDARDSL